MSSNFPSWVYTVINWLVCTSEPLQPKNDLWPLSEPSSNTAPFAYNKTISYNCNGLERNLSAPSTCRGRMGWSQNISLTWLPSCTPLQPYIVSNLTLTLSNGSSRGALLATAAEHCALNHGLSLPLVTSASDVLQISANVEKQGKNLQGLLAVPLSNHIPT